MGKVGLTGLGVLTSAGLIWAGAMAGCSASDGRGELTGTSGAGAANSGNGSGASSGSLGQGGFDAVGGMGSGGSGGECAAVNEAALPQYEPADIIFAVDTSGSMTDEIGFTQQNLNGFSNQIVSSGIDVRVVMLAEKPFCPIPLFCPPTGICVDPPLGSGMCPTDDHNPPTYVHLPDTEVGSTDALSVIIDSYPLYSMYLRQQAKKYVVIISDDNATAPNVDNANDFITQFTALDPMLAGFTAHAIYCFDSSGNCVVKGQAYEDLVNATSGIHGNLALQDFTPIFTDMATAVITSAGSLPCEFGIPTPPMGQDLDPNEVNVVFTDGNNQTSDVYKVANAAACDPMTGGWYYDNDAAPTKIILCQASCDVVSADSAGKIDIAFGCATIKPPVN